MPKLISCCAMCKSRCRINSSYAQCIPRICRKRKKVEEEEKEEEEELMDSDMTEEDEEMNFKGNTQHELSAVASCTLLALVTIAFTQSMSLSGTAAAVRERKLRPRKQVSFSLDQIAASLEASDAAAEGSETEDDEVLTRKGSKGSKKRSRGESNAVLDEEGDHPAQLINMQPVSLPDLQTAWSKLQITVKDPVGYSDWYLAVKHYVTLRPADHNDTSSNTYFLLGNCCMSGTY